MNIPVSEDRTPSRNPLLLGPELGGPRAQFMSMHVLILQVTCVEFRLQSLRTR